MTREKAAKLPPIEEVKTILYHSTRGALSTFSQVLFRFLFSSRKKNDCELH
ncbi:hypothetical protein HanOQP8_Chr11g0421261 [Helianthus annuus]|nr:hypothetical protein HanLR1_Chr11g0420371 [Helianthus annuus]KAJ0690747.1 hypothetical protein HanOQP8_Chr11g0421261 [Helianthus annuus]